MPTEQDFSITELAAMAGVTPRTIRYYVSIGLLPSPGQQGPGTRYGEGHLTRLRLIRRLQRVHLPLGEIGSRLAGLDDDSVAAALLADEPTPAPGSALEYIQRLRGQTEIRPMGEPSVVAAPMPAPRAPMPAPSLPGAPAAMVLAPEPNPRSQWDRVGLSQNVELHIRRPLGRLEQKRIERLIRIGREMLDEGDQL